MESSTYIRQLFTGNRIIVPKYQRAYSWDTPQEGSDRRTHTDVFLKDLEEYLNSNSESPYYFGHFLLMSKKEKLNFT